MKFILWFVTDIKFANSVWLLGFQIRIMIMKSTTILCYLNNYSPLCHRDSYLKADIEFLETQGIAGVSHHSLLYSKTAPVQVVNEEEEVIR